MSAATGYSVSTLTDLRNISESIRTDQYIRAVKQTQSWYMFNPTATDADDGANYIAPTTGSGRWYRLKSLVLASEVLNLAEFVEDEIGGAFQDSTTLDFTYNDALNTFVINIISGSITNTHIATNAGILISKISGLPESLDNKSEIGHGHSTDAISGLQEFIVDSIASALQSTNITINYDDNAGTIELTSTTTGGGSGTVTWDTIDTEAWDALYGLS